MIDQATIKVISGKGGNGVVHGRREKFVPRGGPDGGDGGMGGSVYIVANPNLSTLSEFRYKKVFRAEDGGSGAGALKHGKNGSDLRIEVPLGTEIWKIEHGKKELLSDVTSEEQVVLAVRGGQGGRGNARFATSINRFPQIAEQGEPGQEEDLVLELKLLADVGVVGLPNAGKSSLLATVSKAKPKIAEYPFTTLEPVLGVVEHKDTSFVMVDIPGLIEGAHEGLGLGHEFLRHVERTKVLIHMVDGSTEDPLGDLRLIESEMALFNERLAMVPQVVALNKIDIPEVASRQRELLAALGQSGRKVLPISAAAHLGIEPLLDAAIELLQAAKPSVQSTASAVKDLPVLRPQPERRSSGITRRDGVFSVTAPEIVRVAATVDQTNWAARTQFYQYLKRKGVTRQLEGMGIKSGDMVKVGDFEWEWE
ncbi:MAG: GTPase ObgE [SAR202 cluster bacterium]|nr:GTPase ObgE [SAR202 cluster bacterium]